MKPLNFRLWEDKGTRARTVQVKRKVDMVKCGTISILRDFVLNPLEGYKFQASTAKTAAFYTIKWYKILRFGYKWLAADLAFCPWQKFPETTCLLPFQNSFY